MTGAPNRRAGPWIFRMLRCPEPETIILKTQEPTGNNGNAIGSSNLTYVGEEQVFKNGRLLANDSFVTAEFGAVDPKDDVGESRILPGATSG